MSHVRSLLAALLLTTMAACGFQLRGAYDLPFAELAIDLPANSELYTQLRRAIETGSGTRVVAASSQAAKLQVQTNAQAKNVLSVNAAGRVREYELVRQFRFRVVNADNTELLAPATITVRRDITFSDEQVLSKEAEEGLLWKDMQRDIVNQVLRRLATVRNRAT